MMLTKREQRLKDEIVSIAELSVMDHWNILDYEKDSRSIRLQIMKRDLINSQIVEKYTYIDELLSVIICHTYFRRPKKQFSFRTLWRTKKFKAFAHHLLDGVYLLNKMRLVNDLRAIPTPLKNTIERLNALRNAVAHSFFPENRYQYRKAKKVLYRDLDVFSLEGFRVFQDDCQLVIDHLFRRAFGFDLPKTI
jgi:hypothetical protein